MHVVAAAMERAWPKENEHIGARVNTLRDELSSRSRMLLTALLGAALCVLLIGCTNLANLLLARALARRKELAVRTAMGAGRERLVRQLLTESLLLAIGGGIAGVLLAFAALPLLVRLVPNGLPIAETPVIDARVLLAAACITALTALAFGVFPALRACGGDLTGLREGSRGGVGGRKERLRSALVVAEIAATVVLLVSSGLLIRALWRLQNVDPGFRTAGVLTLRTALPMPKYEKTADRARFYAHVLQEARRLPGVSARRLRQLPSRWPCTAASGRSRSPAAIPQRTPQRAMLRYVTPGYFATLGIPLRLGRDVSDTDTREAPFTAVVSEAFARRYWPGENPLGRHFEFALSDRTIVGVVGDIRARGPERESEPQVYIPYRQVARWQHHRYVPEGSRPAHFRAAGGHCARTAPHHRRRRSRAAHHQCAHARRCRRSRNRTPRRTGACARRLRSRRLPARRHRHSWPAFLHRIQPRPGNRRAPRAGSAAHRHPRHDPGATPRASPPPASCSAPPQPGSPAAACAPCSPE